MTAPARTRIALAALAAVTVLVPVGTAHAGAAPAGVQAPGPLTPLLAGPSIGRSTEVGRAPVARAGSRAATISVTYTGFSSSARAAFQRAVDIWKAKLTSPVTIRVSATYADLGNPNLLGSAGPTTIHRDFGAGKAGTWYPVAIANKLAKRDLNGSQPDIVANFNSSFTNWHFATTAPPSNRYDFETVVLHELGHGLGFLSGFFQSGSAIYWGTDGQHWIEDRFITSSSGTLATSHPSGSVAFTNAVTGDNLFWNGTKGKQANGGKKPRLYAPNPWEQGSSSSHLDEDAFPRGNANSLMTPFLGQGERIRNPGGITLGILQDSGWTPPPRATK